MTIYTLDADELEVVIDAVADEYVIEENKLEVIFADRSPEAVIAVSQSIIIADITPHVLEVTIIEIPDGHTNTADIASRTTLLNITEKVPANNDFFVNSGGTYYTKEKDNGFLLMNDAAFQDNEKIQAYLNGTNLIKNTHWFWTSPVSFRFLFAVDAGDFIKVVS